jgi:hypothetical protein
MLAAGRLADVADLAASHLLWADTRPDNRLLWTGDPADPWPYGAWIAGATLVLAKDGDLAAIAVEEMAKLLTHPPASGPFAGWVALRKPRF